MSFEIIIVGSGPAGVSAAWELAERNILILDVGFRAPQPPTKLNQNLYELKSNNEDLSSLLIGDNFESLHNLVFPYISPKLKGPSLSFVTKDWQQLFPSKFSGFEGLVSFAKGGLSNVWGAGVYRFTDQDLKGFPIAARDLDPFYDRLTTEIGVSGCDDDLTRFFGSTRGLLPPIEVDRWAKLLLKRYSRRKGTLERKGIYIGKPRLAVLSTNLGERQAYDYSGLEFFQPNGPAVYNSSYQLQQLQKKPNVKYASGYLVQRYVETDNGITVIVRNLNTNRTEQFSAHKLILAAGTISTSKIVLASHNDHTTRLPLLDNAVSFIPFVVPQLIGAAQEKQFFSGVQLNLVHCTDKYEAPLQGSFYGTSGILKGDLLLDLPLSVKGNLAAAKYLTPALGVLSFFYPDSESNSNYLQLNANDELEIRYEKRSFGKVETEIIAAFRRLGYFSLPSLVKYPPPGNSFHYAGSLPMKNRPQKFYETSSQGQLFGSRHVYIVDGSNFSALPSKNHTFTIMANSMRIAHHLKREFGE